MATTEVLARGLGTNTVTFLLGCAAIVALALFGVVLLRARVQARRRAAERARVDRWNADRGVRWAWFSRPNLEDQGRTWLVGIERRTEDDRVLTGPILVTDDPIPRDHANERIEAESQAMLWAEEYNGSGVR